MWCKFSPKVSSPNRVRLRIVRLYSLIMFSSIKTPLYILQTYNVHFVQTHFFFGQYTFQYCHVEFSPKVSSPKNWIFGHILFSDFIQAHSRLTSPISFSDLRTLIHFRRIKPSETRTFGLKNPISFSDQRTFGQTKLRQRAVSVSCYKKIRLPHASKFYRFII